MDMKLIGLIGGAVMAGALWVPEAAYGFGGTLTITYNSIHCTDLISGGTRQTVNDGAATCTIKIKEIGTVCRNKGGNADKSNSHIFNLNPTEITESQAGANFNITKNGSILSDIFFTKEEIAAAVGDQISLDPAVLCPNRNFSILTWAVTRFDMVGTVHTVVQGYLPFFRDRTNPDSGPSATTFDSCDPDTSGLTYGQYTTVSGVNSPVLGTFDTTKGILGECWLFRNQYSNVNSFFQGKDKGGVVFEDSNFTPGGYYNGVCQQHGKQGGSIGNIGKFNIVGPAADDPECTGLDTVLDGSY